MSFRDQIDNRQPIAPLTLRSDPIQHCQPLSRRNRNSAVKEFSAFADYFLAPLSERCRDLSLAKFLARKHDSAFRGDSSPLVSP